MPRLRYFAIAVLFALSALRPALAQVPETGLAEVTLTILHTNDVHGHILPFAYTEVGRSKDEQPSVGGDARRATLIRQIRAQTANPTILIDSGDTFTRGPFTNLYLGVADIEAMNSIGYELAALGNNEFKAKDGVEDHDAAGAQSALLKLIKRSRFPWICANATDEHGAMLKGVQPFVVRKFGNLRVGFLGLTTPRVAGYPQAKGWVITDAIKAAQHYIPIAREQCDVLIAVTHIGFESKKPGDDSDEALAAQTTGLDAIVGGDSHTFLYKAVEVKNADGSKIVPIVQDGEFGVNLGKFDLHFVRSSSGWKLADYKYELIPVGPTLAEAPDVAATIAPFAVRLMDVVGKLPQDQIGKDPKERTRLTTQVFVEAMRRQTRADFAMSPIGSGFFDVFRAPAVRRYDVYAAMPFHDHVVVATLTGAQLKGLIDGRKDNVVAGDLTGLDPSKMYKVAFEDFIASSEYKLPSSAVTDTGIDLSEMLISDLQGRR